MSEAGLSKIEAYIEGASNDSCTRHNSAQITVEIRAIPLVARLKLKNCLRYTSGYTWVLAPTAALWLANRVHDPLTQNETLFEFRWIVEVTMGRVLRAILVMQERWKGRSDYNRAKT